MTTGPMFDADLLAGLNGGYFQIMATGEPIDPRDVKVQLDDDGNPYYLVTLGDQEEVAG